MIKKPEWQKTVEATAREERKNNPELKPAEVSGKVIQKIMQMDELITQNNLTKTIVTVIVQDALNVPYHERSASLSTDHANEHFGTTLNYNDTLKELTGKYGDYTELRKLQELEGKLENSFETFRKMNDEKQETLHKILNTDEYLTTANDYLEKKMPYNVLSEKELKRSKEYREAVEFDKEKAFNSYIEKYKDGLEKLSLYQQEILDNIYKTQKTIIDRAKEKMERQSKISNLDSVAMGYIQTALNLDSSWRNRKALAEKYNYNFEALELINMLAKNSAEIIQNPLQAFEIGTGRKLNGRILMNHHVPLAVEDIARNYYNRNEVFTTPSVSVI